MFAQYVNNLQHLYILLDKINSDVRTLVYNDLFLSWRWWIALALTIIPWIVWFKIRKKDSTNRLLYAGFVTLLLASYMDILGVQLGLWNYNIDIEPITPSFDIFDFTLMPVSIMMFLQYKPKINPIIKAIIFSGIASFIAEPLFIWLNFYNPRHWEHYYSFPIFIVIYLIAHYCVTRKDFNKLIDI